MTSAMRFALAAERKFALTKYKPINYSVNNDNKQHRT